jgi:hypothetical protein
LRKQRPYLNMSLTDKHYGESRRFLMVVVVMTIVAIVMALRLTPVVASIALMPAAFALPLLLTSPLFMAPPAMIIVLIAIVPPARLAPAAAVPVITATIAVSQMQRHARRQVNGGPGSLNVVDRQRRQAGQQSGKNRKFHLLLLISGETAAVQAWRPRIACVTRRVSLTIVRKF